MTKLGLDLKVVRFTHTKKEKNTKKTQFLFRKSKKKNLHSFSPVALRWTLECRDLVAC